MREASGYPFLLGLMASFYDIDGFHLVSEYCRSTLFDERDHMPESHRKLASAELACAVNHLHYLGIIHRDIKLENVMLKDGHVVLGDFELALRLGGPHLLAPHDGGSVQVNKNKVLKPRGVSGTLPYMAPELLRNMEYSFGVDWFAYGVFLHVFYMDKFPWLGEYDHPASYLKEMMSTISVGIIFEDGSFGDLLRKLLCVDQHARANFSVVRGTRFFSDFDWPLVHLNSSASSVSRRPADTNSKVPSPPIMNNPLDSDPYPDFTWLNPSMIVDEVTTPDLGDADWSPESSIAEPYTPSQFDAPVIEQPPVACGSLQVFDSFSFSHLYRHSTLDFFGSEDHIDEVTRNAAHSLYEVPLLASSPTSCNAAFEDSNPVSLGRRTAAAMQTDEDDGELVRMSIKSLDIGEQPVFDLPSGWKEAFISPTDIAAPISLQAESTKKTSVLLPKLKSLWKRATSKFVSRPM